MFMKMKKRINLLITIVMSFTMIWGLTICTFAGTIIVEEQQPGDTIIIDYNSRCDYSLCLTTNDRNIDDSNPGYGYANFNDKSVQISASPFDIDGYVYCGDQFLDFRNHSDEAGFVFSQQNDASQYVIGYSSGKIVHGYSRDVLPQLPDTDERVGKYGEIMGGEYRLIRNDFYKAPAPVTGGDSSPVAPACSHDFVWQTINAPTSTDYGTEGLVCSKCGAIGNTQKMPPQGEWGISKIENIKSGETMVLDFGPWNSFSKAFLEKVAANQRGTFIFRYTYMGNLYEVTIKPGDITALDFDWYGPAKMAEMFDTVITKM